MRETLLAGPALHRGHYRRDAVEALVASAGAADKKASQRLFCLLLLERWQRIFVDGAAAADVRLLARRLRPEPPAAQT